MRACWIWVTAILVVALGLRVAAAYWWQARLPPGTQFAFGDSDSYWELGRALARGDPYQYGEARVFRAPGYPLLLAALFAAGGQDTPVLAARVVGAVLGALAVGAAMGLAREMFDERAAIVAGALASVYPGALGMSVFILSEALFVPLMLAQLWCWIVAERWTSRSNALGLAALAGLCAGLATLTRPSWLLFIPFVVAAACLFAHQRRRHLAIGAVMLFACCLTMLPWWIRNYQVTGRFVPTTLQTGASLYDGLNPLATGASDMSFVAEFQQQQREFDATSQPLVGSFEERLDRRLHDASLEWTVENKLRALQLAAIKLIRIWNPWPNADEFQSWLFRGVIFLGYTPLVVLAGFGAWRFRTRGWSVAICLLPAAYFTCLHMVFVGSIRYRQPPMMALLVLAAGMITVWWRHWEQKQSSAGQTESGRNEAMDTEGNN